METQFLQTKREYTRENYKLESLIIIIIIIIIYLTASGLSPGENYILESLIIIIIIIIMK
jgi:hypothetical protein